MTRAELLAFSDEWLPERVALPWRNYVTQYIPEDWSGEPSDAVEIMQGVKAGEGFKLFIRIWGNYLSLPEIKL